MRAPGDVLQKVFDAFAEYLDNTIDYALPIRRYFHVGEVAFDGEQFVVHGGSLYQGRVASASPAYAPVAMLAFDFGVTIIRNAPTPDTRGKAPSPDRLAASALEAAKDAELLTKAFYATVDTGKWNDPCDDVAFAGISWDGPSGGTIATSASISLQL